MINKKLFLTSLIALSLLGIGTIETHAQTLQDHHKLEQQKAAERQRVERQNYERACQNGTLEAYKEYLKMYPNGKFVSDINNRIADYDLWSKAKAANTIDAYSNYIRNSRFKSYIEEANEAIVELQSIAVWQTVKGSDNIKDVESFIQEFPKSSLAPTAKKRIHELRAVTFYKSGDYIKAYGEFNEAGGRNSIEEANREFYDECSEYYDYHALNSNSNQLDLQSFMRKYPNSQYFDSVSNMMAISKAKNLNVNSKASSYYEALSYAKDKKTRVTVQSYIDRSKKAYSTFQKQQRRARIRANGGIINLGFEIADIGINPSAYESGSDIDIVWYYNVGLGMKIGNYRSPVQFEIGAKPGFMFYTLWYGSEDESKSAFHLPLYTKLKINLSDTRYGSKLYINATGYYNAVKEDFLESDFSIAGGLGLAWRHWDWSVYYKYDLDNNYDLNQNYGFLGTSFVYYF
jgi:outer membrane protein assembly factor BamD (BamD/ComL family)